MRPGARYRHRATGHLFEVVNRDGGLIHLRMRSPPAHRPCKFLSYLDTHAAQRAVPLAAFKAQFASLEQPTKNARFYAELDER